MAQWSTRYRRLSEHQADDRLTRVGKNFLPVREGMSGLFLRFGLLGGAQLAGSALSFLTAVIITRIGGAVVFGQISVKASC